MPAGQILKAAENGLSVTLGNSDAAKNAQQKFLELVQQLLTAVDGGAQVLFADGKTISRLTTIAREFITTQVNEFGQPVKYFNNVPILSAGYDNAGGLVIGHAEACGNANNTTSIYAVRFGEKADLSIGTNVGAHVLCVDTCLLYTSDAADDMQCVDLGGRRIIKKKKKKDRK
eukprot:TRINITY_DN16131_c0_g1_i1.p2 TRINITY_DN16131_c0_g1~~TRINITY_DN16131_c0_g1_i1.p2  ORF type:complete len:173 (-),score=29.97 TRINITY_DN16131_c0_g1_i1:114-632(-)